MSSSIPGTSAPYGQACTNCSRAKCKCISRGSDTCERCHRRGLQCQPSVAIRNRNGKRQPVTTRASNLEERLEDLITLLRSQHSRAGKQTSEPLPQPSPGSIVPLSNVQNAGFVTQDGPVNKCDNLEFNPLAETMSTSTTVLGSRSHGSPSGLVSEPTPFEAEDILHTFRTKHLLFFPFIYIRPETTTFELQRDRPFLWLNIRAICAKSSVQMYALGHQAREILAQKSLVDLDRSIDLLLGLLAVLGWSTYQTRGRSFLCTYVNLANSLVSDLRLDRTPDQASLNCFKSSAWPKAPRFPSVRSNEDRRAVISCFIISSSISSFLKIDIVRWSPLLNEYLQNLSNEPEHFGDEILVATARLRQLMEDVSRITWRKVDQESLGPPLVFIKALRSRLEQLRNTFSPAISQNKVILSHYYNAQVTINELALSQPTKIGIPDMSQPAPPLPVPSIPSSTLAPNEPQASLYHPIFKPMDIDRLESLHACLHAVKLTMSNYLSFAPHEHPAFPFAIMVHITHSLHLLYRLSLLDLPDWDRAAVRRTADVLVFLSELASKLDKVAEAVGLHGDGDGDEPDIFTRGASAMRATASLWGAALRQADGGADLIATVDGLTEAAENVNGFSESMEDDMQVTMDFGDDRWWADLVYSWEGN